MEAQRGLVAALVQDAKKASVDDCHPRVGGTSTVERRQRRPPCYCGLASAAARLRLEQLQLAAVQDAAVDPRVEDSLAPVLPDGEHRALAALQLLEEAGLRNHLEAIVAAASRATAKKRAAWVPRVVVDGARESPDLSPVAEVLMLVHLTLRSAVLLAGGGPLPRVQVVAQRHPERVKAVKKLRLARPRIIERHKHDALLCQEEARGRPDARPRGAPGRGCQDCLKGPGKGDRGDAWRLRHLQPHGIGAGVLAVEDHQEVPTLRADDRRGGVAHVPLAVRWEALGLGAVAETGVPQ
mmetsp:Transcript_59758/g.159747  ORF Transcript_59758/g.159747 Transcript_59758/m.159747 type:complete len:296 (-) Transcript_59758:765-1652(-)